MTISREEWEAKRQKMKDFNQKNFLRRAEAGAKATAPLLESAINLGLSYCEWGGSVTLYNRETALGILQKQFPDFKLSWWTGQPRIEIK